MTGVTIQELRRTETKPISFHPCQCSTRSLQPLQYTGHSGISPTQRAAMARASDLTWGSNQKPQKLPHFSFHITTAPTSTLIAGTRTKFAFQVKSSMGLGQDLLRLLSLLDKPLLLLSGNHHVACIPRRPLKHLYMPTLRQEPHKWW